MTKKILITGGGGYIGSHAVKFFLENNYQVIVFDNFSRGFRQPLEILQKLGSLEVIEGDLQKFEQIEKVFQKDNFDGVLHFAAVLSVNESMTMPELYFRNNDLGTLNLLEAMRASQTRNLIFSSSCAVFGESQYLPVDEKHPKNPTNPYGESKLIAEKMIAWYCKIHHFSATVLRYFNVCGASSDGSIGDSKRPSPHLMQNLVKAALKIDNFSLTCPTVDTLDGTPIRDYIDVEDLIVAHYQALLYLDTHKGFDDFNLGNGTGYSVKQIVKQVEEVCQTQIPSNQDAPIREGEYAKIFAHPGKANRILQWKTTKTLQDSILSLKKWYEKFPQGYEY